MDAHVTKHRKTTTQAEYEEVLNLVRNTLKVDETEACQMAGYSPGVHNHWRRDGRWPLVALNALRGLLLGKELVAGDNTPLLLSVEDLLLLASEVKSGKLRAALYREVARRVDPKA